MKRIFIAVKVVPGIKLLEMAASLKANLSEEKIKWTTLDNIHITLAFPGNTSGEKIESIDSILKIKCSELKGFQVLMRGAGVFKSFSDPRIIWAGFEKSEELLRLAYSVSDGLRDIGIDLESRPFNPHLTIARIKHVSDKEELKKHIGKYQNSDIQVVSVNEVILFESITMQDGPVYKPLSIHKLHD